MAEASTNPIRPTARNHVQFLYWSPRTANEPLSFLTESGGSEFFRVAPSSQKIQANTISGLATSSIVVEGVTLAAGTITATSGTVTNLTAGTYLKTPSLREKTSGGGIALVGHISGAYNVSVSNVTATGTVTGTSGAFTNLTGSPRFTSLQASQPTYLDTNKAIQSASEGSFRNLFHMAKSGANADITSTTALTSIVNTGNIAITSGAILYLDASTYHRFRIDGNDIWRIQANGNIEPYNGNWNVGASTKRVGSVYSEYLNFSETLVPPYTPTDWNGGTTTWTHSNWAFFAFSSLPSLDPTSCTNADLGNAVNMIMKILVEAGLYPGV